MASSRDAQMRYSSSPDLSDPPSGLSENHSPANHTLSKGRPNEMDEIVVNHVNHHAHHSEYRFDVSGQPVPTKAGVPRRKPGPKPGTKLKRNSTNNTNPDGSPGDATKQRRPRKPKDPTAPPVVRKRKQPSNDPDSSDLHMEQRAASASANGPAFAGLSALPGSTINRLEAQPTSGLKREASTSQPRVSSMSSLLNAEPEPPRPSAPPSRTSGTNYDPIRSNYDPVRETMVPHPNHSFSSNMGSPRVPSSNMINRASASPSIASLVDPAPQTQNIVSPLPSRTNFSQNPNTQSPRPSKENGAVSGESPNPFRQELVAPPPVSTPKPPMSETKKIAEIKKPAPTPSFSARSAIEIRPTSITTIGAGSRRTPPKNQSVASSSPRMAPQKDSALPLPGGVERSILDFGKAEPGNELTTPSIVLHIPLNGETNKYVNFMRVAEERYGWEALHPRQAEHRARKARIAAASAALAQADSSREGDEMSVDESENEDSNIEMGGMSGAEKPGPKKKKRHFKEDEYDKEDDFVDDSEMLWEEQAAASKDGFFVYSGPLIPEAEKPALGRYVCACYRYFALGTDVDPQRRWPAHAGTRLTRRARWPGCWIDSWHRTRRRPRLSGWCRSKTPHDQGRQGADGQGEGRTRGLPQIHQRNEQLQRHACEPAIRRLVRRPRRDGRAVMLLTRLPSARHPALSAIPRQAGAADRVGMWTGRLGWAPTRAGQDGGSWYELGFWNRSSRMREPAACAGWYVEVQEGTETRRLAARAGQSARTSGAESLQCIERCEGANSMAGRTWRYGRLFYQAIPISRGFTMGQPGLAAPGGVGLVSLLARWPRARSRLVHTETEARDSCSDARGSRRSHPVLLSSSNLPTNRPLVKVASGDFTWGQSPLSEKRESLIATAGPDQAVERHLPVRRGDIGLFASPRVLHGAMGLGRGLLALCARPCPRWVTWWPKADPGQGQSIGMGSRSPGRRHR